MPTARRSRSTRRPRRSGTRCGTSGRWSIVDGRYRHHNGAAQVFDEGSGTRFVWTTDLLADEEVVELTDQSMGIGIGVVKKTLEAVD